MRALMAAVIGMGVLIVAGVTVLVVVMVQRMSAAPAPIASAVPTMVALDEPAGSRIAGQSLSGDRLALQLAGGGPDRVVVVDVRTGRVVGKAELAR